MPSPVRDPLSRRREPRLRTDPTGQSNTAHTPRHPGSPPSSQRPKQSKGVGDLWGHRCRRHWGVHSAEERSKPRVIPAKTATYQTQSVWPFWGRDLGRGPAASSLLCRRQRRQTGRTRPSRDERNVPSPIRRHPGGWHCPVQTQRHLGGNRNICNAPALRGFR